MTKKLKNVSSDLFSTYIDYTPERLRNIADEMETNGMESFSLEVEEEYGSVSLYCFAKRLETEEEYRSRLSQEEARRILNEKAKRRDEEETIRRAAELGMVFKNEE